MSELKREYEYAKQKRDELDLLVSQKIAGTLDIKINCPDEILKQHLQALKIYVNALEQRLKYEE